MYGLASKYGGYSEPIATARGETTVRFTERQPVRAVADSRTGKVIDPDYVNHRVLVLWDKPDGAGREWSALWPEELKPAVKRRPWLRSVFSLNGDAR